MSVSTEDDIRGRFAETRKMAVMARNIVPVGAPGSRVHLEDRFAVASNRPALGLTLEPGHEERLDMGLLTCRRPRFSEKSLFVIAPDGEHLALFQESDNLIREAVLGDHIPEAEHLVNRPHDLERAQQGADVAVNVRNYSDHCARLEAAAKAVA